MTFCLTSLNYTKKTEYLLHNNLFDRILQDERDLRNVNFMEITSAAIILVKLNRSNNEVRERSRWILILVRPLGECLIFYPLAVKHYDYTKNHSNQEGTTEIQ